MKKFTLLKITKKILGNRGGKWLECLRNCFGDTIRQTATNRLFHSQAPSHRMFFPLCSVPCMQSLEEIAGHLSPLMIYQNMSWTKLTDEAKKKTRRLGIHWHGGKIYSVCKNTWNIWHCLSLPRRRFLNKFFYFSSDGWSKPKHSHKIGKLKLDFWIKRHCRAARMERPNQNLEHFWKMWKTRGRKTAANGGSPLQKAKMLLLCWK